MTRRTYLIVVATLIAVVLTMSNGSLFGKSRVKKPAGSEFGIGPRTSAQGLYVVTIEDTRFGF